MSGSPYLTTQDVAERLRCTVRTVHELTRNNEIPHRKLPGGRRCLFDEDSLKAWEDGAPLHTQHLPPWRQNRPARNHQTRKTEASALTKQHPDQALISVAPLSPSPSLLYTHSSRRANYRNHAIQKYLYSQLFLI